MFNNKKDLIVKGYKNTLKSEAYNRKGEFINLLVNPKSTGIQTLIEESAKITYQEFTEMKKNWLNQVTTEWLICGHLLEQDAIELVQKCEEIIKPQKAEVWNDKSFILINKNTVNEYAINHPDENNLNSTAICYWQSDKKTEDLKLYALNSVLFTVLRHVSYNTLRTQEQLGYVVFCNPSNIRKILGGSILIHSPKKDPEFLVHRINAFLDSQRNQVDELTEEEFEKFRQSVIATAQVKDINLYEESGRAWDEVYDQFYMFNRQEKYIEALKDITKDELIDYFQSIFWRDWRRINIKITCSSHSEDIDQDIKEINSKFYIDNNFEVVQINPDDVKSFHDANSLIE